MEDMKYVNLIEINPCSGYIVIRGVKNSKL